MTVVVTRNVSNRIRGFLASVMLELAPGVYTSPRLSSAVRLRIWEVLEDWFLNCQDASVIMIWKTSDMPGELDVKVLGIPRVDLAEADGIILSRRFEKSNNTAL